MLTALPCTALKGASQTPSHLSMMRQKMDKTGELVQEKIVMLILMNLSIVFSLPLDAI